MPNIFTAVNYLIRIANDDSHGYDQKYRLSPDFDCSSLLARGLYEAGFTVSPSSYTGNLEKQLRACGFVDCEPPFRCGDVHLTPYKHCCMSISDTKIVQATINEKGKTVGGESGDQTGKEICIANYYNPSYGWKLHLRYQGENLPTATISLATIAREVIAGLWGNGSERKKKLTEAGYDYKEVQTLVNNLLKGKTLKSVGEIAREVINGKWGNGEQRKKKLTESGYNYSEVQKLVNEILREV